MIRAILTDIEGTTSALAFVKEVLFPYAHARMAAFVQAHGREPEVAQLLAEARAAAGRELDETELVAQLRDWIATDRKVTPLKALQGLIWAEGYQRGDFRGHVYEDAARQLRAWHQRGIALYVYSSGSVHAQRLLFGYSEAGDLTPLFAGYFDTRIGQKRETESYLAIATAIGLPAADLLFLSDLREELDAARAAGMQTCWLVREGALTANPTHRQARDFDAVPC
jgi:enolase-phosphatase E1